MFGILKKCFKVVVTPQEYSLEFQAQLVPALAVIHNFICIHDPGTMSILKMKTKMKRYKILCPKSMRAMVILQISEGVLQSAGSKLPMQYGGITEDQIKTTVIVFKIRIYAVVCVPICVSNWDSTGSLLPHLFHYPYQFSVQSLCNKPFFSCRHARQS